MKFAENIKRAFHMTAFKLRVMSPEILVVTGVVGTVVGAVMACKATMKLDDILSEAGETAQKINDAAEDESLKEKYSEDDRKRDLAVCYAKTGVKIAKLYAPAAIVGGLSIASVLTGHNILRKRNLALAAAYATIDKSFREYRKGVIDNFGEEVDRKIKNNLKSVEVTETVSDDVTGEPKEVKRTIDAATEWVDNEYARLFMEGNPNWKRDMSYNLAFLKAQEQYANDILRSRGYLFLNEVYESLGFKPTKAGQVVGWIYDPKNSDLDNYVDFGMREVYKLCETGDYIEDWERLVLLDFNADGDILSRAKW